MPLTPSLIVLASLAAGLWLLLRRARVVRRRRAMSGVLDAADALESRLRTARREFEAIAGDGMDPVRAAMQDMLRQRLWLQQHGDRASLGQLVAVRTSIDAARTRIEQELSRIAGARSPLR